MKNVSRRRPSASMVVALLALVMAASGTAVAASGMVKGDSLIKKHSLSGNRLRSHTITGQQVKMSKLGTVPSANDANFATTAGSAAITRLTYVSNTATIPPYSGTGVNVVLVTASCPAGTRVVGGGDSVADQQHEYINDSYPQGETGWAADVVNDDTTSLHHTTVTAICAPAAATTP